MLGAKGEPHFPDLENTAWRECPINTDIAKLFPPDNRDALQEGYQGLSQGRGYVENRVYQHNNHNIRVEYR